MTSGDGSHRAKNLEYKGTKVMIKTSNIFDLTVKTRKQNRRIFY